MVDGMDGDCRVEVYCGFVSWAKKVKSGWVSNVQGILLPL